MNSYIACGQNHFSGGSHVDFYKDIKYNKIAG